jgi:hypothetical protein
MSKAAALYRSILKVHRQKLPVEMRQMGDEYVKSEFRLHKKATNQAQLTDFFQAWEHYLRTMQQSAGKFGRDMEKEETKKLNDEQRIKLAQLRDEARNSMAGTGVPVE